jgi:hypothetical protein
MAKFGKELFQSMLKGTENPYKILGFRSVDCEECHLLGCDVMWLLELTYQNISPP